MRQIGALEKHCVMECAANGAILAIVVAQVNLLASASNIYNISFFRASKGFRTKGILGEISVDDCCSLKLQQIKRIIHLIGQ